MALLGSEGAIKCPKCGGINFEEKVVIQFHESLNMDKLKKDLDIGAKGNARSRRYAYFCCKCSHQIA